MAAAKFKFEVETWGWVWVWGWVAVAKTVRVAVISSGWPAMYHGRVRYGRASGDWEPEMG